MTEFVCDTCENSCQNARLVPIDGFTHCMAKPRGDNYIRKIKQPKSCSDYSRNINAVEWYRDIDGSIGSIEKTLYGYRVRVTFRGVIIKKQEYETHRGAKSALSRTGQDWKQIN